MLQRVFGRSSGIGSWPGNHVMEAARTVLGEFSDPGIPHLVELPSRGPGGDLIGRGAALLVDTPIDLQPAGWRLVSRPGRDLERALSMMRQDLDVLAEVADGFQGPLKLQVAGPWTLCASLHLPRLERAVADPGACRDIAASLAEGVARHVAEVRRLVPGAQVVLQVDEPSIGAVLTGGIATASGFGRLRAVDEPVVVEALGEVLSAASSAGAVHTLIHTCASDVPVAPLLRTGAAGLAVDLTRLGIRGWETLAPALEGGRWLWAGAVPTSAPAAGAVTGRPATSRGADAAADAVWIPWRRLGLDPRLLDQVVVTPACGLATLAPATARAVLTAAVSGARELGGRAQG